MQGEGRFIPEEVRKESSRLSRTKKSVEKFGRMFAMLTALSAAEMAAAPNEAKAETKETSEDARLESEIIKRMDTIVRSYSKMLERPEYDAIREKVYIDSELVTVFDGSNVHTYPEILIKYNGDTVLREHLVDSTDDGRLVSSDLDRLIHKIIDNLNFFEMSAFFESSAKEPSKEHFDLRIYSGAWKVMAKSSIKITQDQLILWGDDLYVDLTDRGRSKTVEILKKDEDTIIVRVYGNDEEVFDVSINKGWPIRVPLSHVDGF